jgi:hypothetical protein
METGRGLTARPSLRRGLLQIRKRFAYGTTFVLRLARAVDGGTRMKDG